MKKMNMKMKKMKVETKMKMIKVQVFKCFQVIKERSDLVEIAKEVKRSDGW